MICTKVAACVKKEMAGRKIEICDNKAEQCVQSSDRRTLVKCEEKRKKYTFENTLKNHIISYKMDGGIIRTDSRVPEGTNKCDYLYVVNSEGLIAILIELKGENVSKALKQIYASLMQYKDVFDQFAHV